MPLGRTSARLSMSTASAPLSIVGVRHHSTSFVLRATPCVGRAWRGAGAERPVQNQATPAVFNSPPVHSALSEQAPRHTVRDQVGQFVEPRCARNASTAFAPPSCAPRSAGTPNTNASTSALVAPRLRSTVRPNPSVNLTRYGRPCKPGPSQSYYRLSPGLQVLPARAGYLER
jgi:hypothetical protein